MKISQNIMHTNALRVTNTFDLKNNHPDTPLSAQLMSASNDEKSLSFHTVKNSSEPFQETSRKQSHLLKALKFVRNLFASCFGWAPQTSGIQANAMASQLSGIQVNAKDNLIILKNLIAVFTNKFDDFLVEGIFRKPGNNETVKNILDLLNTNKKLDSEELPDINDMCSVIKKSFSQAMGDSDRQLMSKNLELFNNRLMPLEEMNLPEALNTFLPLLGRLALDITTRQPK